MDTLITKSNRNNHRVQLTTIQHKLQKLSSSSIGGIAKKFPHVVEYENAMGNDNENDKNEQLSRLQRKLKRYKSGGSLRGDAKKSTNGNEKDEQQPSSIQRKVRRTKSGNSKVRKHAVEKEALESAKADAVRQLLGLVESSSSDIMNSKVTDRDSIAAERLNQDDKDHKRDHDTTETNETIPTVHKVSPKLENVDFKDFTETKGAFPSVHTTTPKREKVDFKDSTETNGAFLSVHTTTPKQEKIDSKKLFSSSCRGERTSQTPRNLNRRGSYSMEVKSASCRDLCENQTSTRKGLRHRKKKESSRSETIKPASCGDVYDESQAWWNVRHRKKKERSLGRHLSEDNAKIESSPTEECEEQCQDPSDSTNADSLEDYISVHSRGKYKARSLSDDQNDFYLSKDQVKPSQENVSTCDSFLQEDPSCLGDFHTRPRVRSKSQDESRNATEQQPQPQQQQSQQQPNQQQPQGQPQGQQEQPRPQSNNSSFSDGLVLHSSSAVNDDEDDAARRRRRRCSSGGKVLNHRTQEEYTGFFLTSPTEDNIKHGYGITKFSDGRVFEGVYKRGAMVEGKMTYPAAVAATALAIAVAPSTYVGKFDKDGLRCGKGIYITATTTFLGEFHRDEQQGSGILIYHESSDGNDDGTGTGCSGMAAAASASHCRRFVGHWKTGLRHGHGREILADGTVHKEGLWEDGIFVGSASWLRRKE